MIFVGDDWAEDHHDVELLDEEGRTLARRRLPEGVTGVGALHALVAEHAQDPAEVAVGIETDRGLWVASLVAAGYEVYAVNPLVASRYRDRQAVSGPSPTPATPTCWPIWCAPTATSTARSRETPTRPRPSRCWPAPTIA